VRDVQISTNMIRLGQLLKLAGLIESTGEAKAFLAITSVTVNGEPEDRRGRQLFAGDEVRADDEDLRVVSSERINKQTI
jgi:ribosome-associated protein